MFYKLLALRANVALFLVFSLVISLVTEKLPAHFYSHERWLYRLRRWEKGGAVYHRLFHVKQWKGRLPEISDFLKSRFRKRSLQENRPGYIMTFVMESCKAEFTHYVIIAFSLLFFLWTTPRNALIVVLVSLAFNLPYIVIQRYNRPRLLRLLQKDEQHASVPAPVGAHA